MIFSASLLALLLLCLCTGRCPRVTCSWPVHRIRCTTENMLYVCCTCQTINKGTLLKFPCPQFIHRPEITEIDRTYIYGWLLRRSSCRSIACFVVLNGSREDLTATYNLLMIHSSGVSMIERINIWCSCEGKIGVPQKKTTVDNLKSWVGI